MAKEQRDIVICMWCLLWKSNWPQGLDGNLCAFFSLIERRKQAESWPRDYSISFGWRVLKSIHNFYVGKEENPVGREKGSWKSHIECRCCSFQNLMTPSSVVSAVDFLFFFSNRFLIISGFKLEVITLSTKFLFPFADWLQLWFRIHKLRERGVSHSCHQVSERLYDTRQTLKSILRTSGGRRDSRNKSLHHKSSAYNNWTTIRCNIRQIWTHCTEKYP